MGRRKTQGGIYQESRFELRWWMKKHNSLSRERLDPQPPNSLSVSLWLQSKVKHALSYPEAKRGSKQQERMPS